MMEWQKTISREAGFRRCLILYGNVRDLWPTNDGRNLRLSQLVTESLQDSFNLQGTWDSIDGLSFPNASQLTTFNDMMEATSSIEEEGDEYEFWEVYVDDYVQKIELQFQDSNINIHEYFEEYARPTILYFLQNVIAQVKLREDYILSFESCDGDINAYYIPSQNKILFCYELVEEFMTVKTEIILLKESL